MSVSDRGRDMTGEVDLSSGEDRSESGVVDGGSMAAWPDMYGGRQAKPKTPCVRGSVREPSKPSSG